jgi:hypothetical protein
MLVGDAGETMIKLRNAGETMLAALVDVAAEEATMIKVRNADEASRDQTMIKISEVGWQLFWLRTAQLC